MDCGVSLSCRTPGVYCSVLAEISGLSSRCDCRVAMVHPCALLRIAARGLHMLSLSRNSRNMPLVYCGLLARGWTRLDSASSAVEADTALVVVPDPFVVNIVKIAATQVVDGAVIEEVSVVPTASFVPSAPVAVAVVDPAVEADGRPPIAIIEKIAAVAPAPITRRPKIALFRRHYPGSGYPIVVGDAVVID